MRFTKEKYVEKPALSYPPRLTGLGANSEPAALTQRFIFPSAAAAEHLSTLRILGERIILEASEEERADFETLSAKIVSRIIKKTYGGERLATSLYEYAYGREWSDLRSIVVALDGAKNGQKIIEVGYRSTRLDPHGKQITKPRVYLGSVRELDDETVLLDTTYGIRRLRIKGLAWAVIPPAQNMNLSGLELRVTGPKEAPGFSMHIMQRDEIVKDEPREIFAGEEEIRSTALAVSGGLRKIPINASAVRLLLPYSGRRVYLEVYTNDGKQWCSAFAELHKATWNAIAEYKLTLRDEHHENIFRSSNGYILIALPEDLPENNL